MRIIHSKEKLADLYNIAAQNLGGSVPGKAEIEKVFESYADFVTFWRNREPNCKIAVEFQKNQSGQIEAWFRRQPN